MTDTLESLLLAVLSRPEDDAPRLIMADALDDHAGDGPCGRCLGEGSGPLASKGGVLCSTDCPACSGTGRVSNGFAERAKFTRVQVELARWKEGELSRETIDRHATLRRRERELWQGPVDLKWFCDWFKGPLVGSGSV